MTKATSAMSCSAVIMLVLASCTSVPAHQDPGYALTASYPLGGPGRWDLLAVDPLHHHLLISRSDHVQVMDTSSGRQVGTLDATDGVHGIETAPGLVHGYASNGRTDTVTEFDLETLQRIRDIKLSGHSPDAMAYDSLSGRLFVFNADSNNASVIDPALGKEIAVIAFDGNPELAVSDGNGHVFVNIEDKAELVRIDATSMQVAQSWALQGCDGPTGLAFDRVHGRLFSACQNQAMVVTDANDGHQVARIAIGKGPDGAAFDQQAQLVFIPNGKSGTLTIAHEDDADHFRVVQTLATTPGARTIAIDPQSHRLYLPAAAYGAQPQDSHKRPDMLPDSFRVLVVSQAD